MRDRLLDFLPLLLALGLIAAWFGFQQPLPWLGLDQPAPTLQQQPLTPTSTPISSVPRATALQSLCDSGRPRFLGSLANLKTRIGAEMGDPKDCEHAVDADGNTQQQTTTGLAYYRRRLNAAVFTNGWDHWALSEDKLLRWSGNEVEPPADATTD
jgi:hypothetical protein